MSEVIIYSGLDRFNKDNKYFKSSIFDKYLGKDFAGILTTDSDYNKDKYNKVSSDYVKTDPDNISHQIKNLRIKDKNVLGDLVILNTPNGVKLNNLLKDKIPLEFRIRGIISLTGFDVVYRLDLAAIDCVVLNEY